MADLRLVQGEIVTVTYQLADADGAYPTFDGEEAPELSAEMVFHRAGVHAVTVAGTVDGDALGIVSFDLGPEDVTALTGWLEATIRLYLDDEEAPASIPFPSDRSLRVYIRPLPTAPVEEPEP